MKLRAIKDLWYNGGRRTGEEFEASKNDAWILVAVKAAEYVTVSQEEQYQTKEQSPELKQKRKYNRKDMIPIE